MCTKHAAEGFQQALAGKAEEVFERLARAQVSIDETRQIDSTPNAANISPSLNFLCLNSSRVHKCFSLCTSQRSVSTHSLHMWGLLIG